MPNNRPVVGMNPIPGFNGGENIDLNIYQNHELPTQIYGTFSHIGSIDLTEVDEDDPIWLNDAIRDDGNTLERIEDFENTFELKGFDTRYDPCIMGTDGKPRDGRGRVIGAKRRGEKRIPAFFYSYESDTERCRVSNGVKENLKHDPAYAATREDIIKAALYLIGRKELIFDEKSIRKWLFEIEIEKKFNQRNITMIKDSILKRGVDGGKEVVRIRSRSDWERWILKNLNKKVNKQNGNNNENVWLTSVDNDTYPYRVFAQSIVQSIARQIKQQETSLLKQDIKPAEIILYTNQKTHSDAQKCVKQFKKDLDRIIIQSYLMVSKDYDFPYPLPIKKPQYVILGAIPQLIGEHNVDGNKLVPLEDY